MRGELPGVNDESLSNEARKMFLLRFCECTCIATNTANRHCNEYVFAYLWTH